MNLQVSDLITSQYINSLNAMIGLIKKAQAHASAQGFDENKFLDIRMAPDMFPFSKQVQIMSDNAKGAVARLSGKENPNFSDDEKTMNELIHRLDKTISFLKEFKENDFLDYGTKKISFPWYPGKELSGHDYLVSFALPNFYFHMTTAYALLRANGVKIGKADYLGQLNWKNL